MIKNNALCCLFCFVLVVTDFTKQLSMKQVEVVLLLKTKRRAALLTYITIVQH